MSFKSRLTEAQFERMADHMVMRRLSTDTAYLHAENAEAQREAEERIEAEVIAELEFKYDVQP